MRVGEICSREAVTVPSPASLREAALLMRNRHVGALVVVEAGEAGPRPVGVLTDRDIVVAVIAVPGARPEGIRACDAMSSPLVVAREDEGVLDAASKMGQHGLRRLPVLDAHGALFGIVTANDILRALGAGIASLTASSSKGAAREQAVRHKIEPAQK